MLKIGVKNMRSLCISTGCSFTDHDFFNHTYGIENPSGFKWWDQHLAEHAGLKLINRAKSGDGPINHLNRTLQAIAQYGEDIELITIGMSSWSRFMFPYMHGLTKNNPPHFLSRGKPGMYAWNELRKDYPEEIYKASVKTAFTCMYAIQQAAKANGIKLFVFQLLHPVNIVQDFGPTKSDRPAGYISGLLNFEKSRTKRKLDVTYATYKIIEEYPLMEKIEDDEQFWGAPFIPLAGGIYVWDKMHMKEKDGIDPVYLELARDGFTLDYNEKSRKNNANKQCIDAMTGEERDRTGEPDRHPNSDGQRYIFKKIKDGYDNLYK